MSKSSQPSNSELHVKANLNEDIEEELNKEDPSPDMAKAVLDNNVSGTYIIWRS